MTSTHLRQMAVSTGSAGEDEDMSDSSVGEMDAFEEVEGHVNDNVDVTAHLAASGPIGLAAAAAIASANKSRKRKSHLFETNPSTRKRQATRLFRKLKNYIEEYAVRVGQQAVVLICTPGKPHNNFRVVGAKPLEDVVKTYRDLLMQELELQLSQVAPPPAEEDPNLYELPPLVIDGIPTPVDKMTQAQLRAFIPLMLKFATGRGKPGWGKEAAKPAWWPVDIPWANVRSDVRTDQEKQRVSWTHALRQIVLNCYKYHGRDDLLPPTSYSEPMATSVSEEQQTTVVTVKTIVQEKIDHRLQNDSRVSIITSTGVPSGQTSVIETAPPSTVMKTEPIQMTQYTPTVVQTISNPDGTVSVIHVEAGSLVTLPDGTQAQVQTISHTDGNLHTLAEASEMGETVSVSDLSECNLSENQYIIRREDGTNAYPVLTVPVSVMYPNIHGTQTVQMSLAQLQAVVNGQQVQVVMGSSQGDGGDMTSHTVEVVTVSADPSHIVNS